MKYKIALAGIFSVDTSTITTTASNEIRLVGNGTEDQDLFILQEKISKLVTEYFRDKELGR
jgi:hypothetical protein